MRQSALCQVYNPLATAVAALPALSASADAGHYRQGTYGGHPHARHAPPPYQHYPEPRHEKRRDNSARNIAIAIGAVMLGAILAQELGRNGRSR